MQTTIVRIGNSLGSRIPKAQLDKLGLREGDRVELTIKRAGPDKAKAIAALRAIADAGGPFTKIDVEKWEAERKAEWQQKDRRLRDIFGR